MRAVAGSSSDLALLGEQIQLDPPTPAEKRHAAALTVAEAAIAGDWPRGDLVDVLASLGLDDVQEVPC